MKKEVEDKEEQVWEKEVKRELLYRVRSSAHL